MVLRGPIATISMIRFSVAKKQDLIASPLDNSQFNGLLPK